MIECKSWSVTRQKKVMARSQLLCILLWEAPWQLSPDADVQEVGGASTQNAQEVLGYGSLG